jgi:hypothetical protein
MRKKVGIRYYMMQIIDNYQIKECIFHFNSLMLREEGKCREEIIIMCESEDTEETVI